MLLAEGMNIKVLPLPDGDDPASFSRKHTAEDFRDYIKEHQTDFIQFKTDLTLKGVTDPIKRSEAIADIVKTISVIPDPIKRDTYLHDCATRLGVNEQTLLNSMNKDIRANREEKRKEREREERGEASLPNRTIVSPSGDEKGAATSIEALLIREVIRHGEEIIFDNVETEDGQTVSLTVAQYIDYDLGQDGLQLSDERYRQILQEAVEHSGEKGFKAETYFVRHPDPAISQLAANLAMNRYQLSASMDVPQREGNLSRQVIHLVLDFRMDIVTRQLKYLQQQLREAGNDMDRIKEVLNEQKRMQELRNALARQLGNDIIGR